MSREYFNPRQVQVVRRKDGYFVHHDVLAETSKVNVRKATPGPDSVQPRTYTPRTGGGHEAVLNRFRDRHTRLVQQANDLTRERDQLNAPVETDAAGETPE